ncbi:MAG: DEAD/DEAH box helicase family protein, partial [Candidatus Parcubacteria bacterium]|nr:DEAD/DEAH box helicase family protein [Candidatus Parcubacteria bacterium]
MIKKGGKDMTLTEILGNIRHYLKSNVLSLRLRPGQISIFQSLHDFLISGQTQGYLKLPSGVGKTNLAIELAISGGFKKVLFLVPTITLVNQTVERFHSFSGFTDIGTFTGKSKCIDKPIIVATYQSFQKLAQYANLLKQFELVIWDEVHHALTPKRQKIMTLFTKQTIHLGLTASDQYNEDKGVANFIPRIAQMSIEEAIKLNMLCSVRCWITTTDIDLSSIKIIRGDYDARAQKRVIDVYRRNRQAVQIYGEYLYGQTCLVTCINIEHALKVAQLFQKAGIKAQAVWGSNQRHYLPDKELKQRLHDFQTGKLHVLTTVDLIDTGFDNTLLTALINLRITSSIVKATQRGGRVLRLFSENDLHLPMAQQMANKFGGKIATIVDLLDDCGNHGFRPVLFSDILEGIIELSPAMEQYRPVVTKVQSEKFLWPSGEQSVKIKLHTDLTEVA